MSTAAFPPPAGWTPVALVWRDGRPIVRWCFTEGIEFTDPFFDQTIERCLRDPFRLLFWRETAIESPEELSATPELGPAGLIFHMSRCGSTLLSQMLAALPGVLVLSEPGPVEAVLRARMHRPEVSDEQAVEWLRSIVCALGRRRRTGHPSYVVKLGTSAILHLPLFRRAFPDARCVFVYRNPVEVVVSQLDHAGFDLIRGGLPPHWLGLTLEDLAFLGDEEYCAAALAAFCASALHGARDGELTLVEYSTLPAATTGVVAPLFGIPVGAGDHAALAATQARDAKNVAVPFVPDAVLKQRRSTPAIEAAVNSRLAPLYESLQGVRRGG